MIKFLRWLHQFEKTKIYPIFEDYFVVGTKKSFMLHSFLLWTNIFLSILGVWELFLHHEHIAITYIAHIELFFGVLFLFEFILKSVYISIPNTIKGGTFMIINFVVILSLVMPGGFGNLALLRIIRSMKIIKIFYFKKEVKEDRKIINKDK